MQSITFPVSISINKFLTWTVHLLHTVLPQIFRWFNFLAVFTIWNPCLHRDIIFLTSYFSSYPHVLDIPLIFKYATFIKVLQGNRVNYITLLNCKAKVTQHQLVYSFYMVGCQKLKESSCYHRQSHYDN